MDLAIIYGPAVDLHLQVQSIGREDIVAVGPPGSGLNRKKQVDLKWLAKQEGGANFGRRDGRYGHGWVFLMGFVPPSIAASGTARHPGQGR
jgi:DNA-binding transcriptional LysR family regulator